MKKTDLITKIAAMLVFLALACYLGVYFWRSVKDPVVTAPAVLATVRAETQISGIVVRDETLLISDAAYISLAVADGKRVAKDSPVAVTYENRDAAARAERIRELELEIRQAESVLSGLVSAEELSARNTAVETAARSLAAAVARHEVTLAEEHSLNLRSLLFANSAQTVTAGDLIVLRAELEKLTRVSVSDTESVTAPASGVFSTLLDGYEHLKTSALRSLTPTQLREMMDSPREAPANAIGKLVGASRWYFAALLDAEAFDAASATLCVGGRVTLEMGRYYGLPLEVKIEDIGRTEDGGRVVVFSCTQALADTLAMRKATATLVVDRHSGIRVPKQAVYSETAESGETLQYVYTLTGVQAEKKYIEIVWETEDFYLAAEGVERVEGAEGAALREGNEIIVSARDLYDGKIME